jgi:hypothetical protein
VMGPNPEADTNPVEAEANWVAPSRSRMPRASTNDYRFGQPVVVDGPTRPSMRGDDKSVGSVVELWKYSGSWSKVRDNRIRVVVG